MSVVLVRYFLPSSTLAIHFHTTILGGVPCRSAISGDPTGLVESCGEVVLVTSIVLLWRKLRSFWQCTHSLSLVSVFFLVESIGWGSPTTPGSGVSPGSSSSSPWGRLLLHWTTAMSPSFQPHISLLCQKALTRALARRGLSCDGLCPAPTADIAPRTLGSFELPRSTVAPRPWFWWSPRFRCCLSSQEGLALLSQLLPLPFLTKAPLPSKQLTRVVTGLLKWGFLEITKSYLLDWLLQVSPWDTDLFWSTTCKHVTPWVHVKWFSLAYDIYVYMAYRNPQHKIMDDRI